MLPWCGLSVHTVLACIGADSASQALVPSEPHVAYAAAMVVEVRTSIRVYRESLQEAAAQLQTTIVTFQNFGAKRCGACVYCYIECNICN